MSSRSPVGSHVVAIPQTRLSWAVDALVSSLDRESLAKLKVRSGEHLSAIMTTAFMFAAPREIDTSGGADLLFEFPEPQGDTPLPEVLGDRRAAAFEVKSIPGQYRGIDAKYDRDLQRGLEPMDNSFTVRFESAKDVIQSSQSLIDRARDQLLKKVGSNTSKNVFLIVHPFDRLAIEATETPPIGYLLDPPTDVRGLDSVWVLWVPDHLTVWSSHRNNWSDFLFTAVGVNEQPLNFRSGLALLQDAESEFLVRTGLSGGSPYLFLLSGLDSDENSLS